MDDYNEEFKGEEYITFKDIERIFRLNRQAVYVLMKKGQLRSFKIGRKRRFKFKDVDALFQSGSEMG